MEPTLRDGDRLLVVRLPPRVDDLVALRVGGRVLVKRVAAVDGDVVTALGDNRDASTDSRAFGPVPRRDVLGRAVYRYAPTARAGRLRQYR